MSVAPVEPPPDWQAVEMVLERLASSREQFRMPTGRWNSISGYDRGWRLLRETELGSSWVRIEYIKACWETFERLGRICRADVLEPGRCSDFMIALFQQVKGVHWDDGMYLVLPPDVPAGSGTARAS